MSKPTAKPDPAALRQQLSRLERSLRRLLGVFFATRHRMVRGSFVVLGKKCGKPNCACTRGEPHPTRCLSWSEDGRTRIAYVSAGDAGAVRDGAQRYQRFRRARADLVKLCARLVKVVDLLAEALIDPYPSPRNGGAANRSKQGDDAGGRRRTRAGVSGPGS